MAMLNRWDPFRDLQRLQEEMGRVFDDRLGLRSSESVGWTPAVDIYEDEEGVALRFDLAGVDPKDVDIRFENGTLTLRGERKLEREDKRDNYHRLELPYGTFTRSFSLPATIDPDNIRAESKNGLLTVHLPKKAEAKPKSIQVKVS
jgi:HSP20 family protein